MEKLYFYGKEFAWEHLPAYGCFRIKGVPYCRHPRVPREQCMDIYAPEAFLSGGQAGGYTAETAPVVFENGLAGYHEAEPFDIEDFRGAAKDFLAAGCVYVSCGCRGRSSVDESGERCGKSPLSLVDLKAGIRFLKSQAGVLPGNMERIVSVGISAGGAMSALLGCTGNSPLYEAALAEMGAETDQTDDIFAAQCYCPITDLDHADMAYEWMFRGQGHYTGMPYVGFSEGDLTPFAAALSGKLADAYAEYFNGLGLVGPDGAPLAVGKEHEGSAYTLLMEKLERSVEKFRKKQLACGKAAPSYPWLSWDGDRAVIASLDAMQKDYHRRLKLCPAFDDLHLIQAENQEFGTPACDKMHFDPTLPEMIKALAEEFPAEAARYLPEYERVAGDEELAARRYLINPMNFIGTKEKADLAPHYRIRVGSKDADTSLMITLTLAAALSMTGKTEVNYEIVWDEPHGRADYPGEVTEWIRGLLN